MKSQKTSWYVYLLLCDKKTFYVGITDNLKGRIIKHKSKESFFTKKFSEVKLVYCEEYPSKYEAAKREKQIKGWNHAKKQLLVDGKLGINRLLSLLKLFGEDEKFTLSEAEESPGGGTSRSIS